MRRLLGATLVSLALGALILLAPLDALAQDELPKRFRDEIDTARVAAEQGDAGPAVQAIAAVGSARLTPVLRDTLAAEFLELGDELSSLKIHGAALDVYRAVARTFTDTSAAHEAANNVGEAMVKLDDRPGAVKVFADLAGPAQAHDAPALAVGREASRATSLRRVGKLLQELNRPAEALVAYLDAVVVHGLDQWDRSVFSGSLELTRALSQLLGRRTDETDEEALEGALGLTRLEELRAPDGTVRRVQLHPVAFLQATALLYESLQQPKRAAAVRALRPRFTATRRVYTLPRTSRFRLRVVRAAQTRFDLGRRGLSELERRAKAADPAALYALSEAVAAGRITPQSFERADRLLAEAGRLGHGPALLRLADAARDRVVAVQHANGALAAGTADALRVLNRSPARLSKTSRAVALRLGAQGSGPAWLALAADSQVPKDRRAFLRRAALCGDTRAFLRLAEHEVVAGEGGTIDAGAVTFWRRGAVLSRQFPPKLFWAQVTADSAWRARLPAASKRYPAAALEATWSHALSTPPRWADAAAAALQGIGTWEADLFGPQGPFTSPLWYMLRKDRLLAPKVRAALAKRTDPLGKHLFGGAFSGGKLGLEVDSARAVLLHREESRSRRQVCNTLWSLLTGMQRAGLAAGERAWAQRASAAGDAWAEAYLGFLHSAGLGGPTDLDAARACFLRAAKRGSRMAHRALAYQEIDLENADHKPRQAADDHLRRAGELGDRGAWVLLARRLERRPAPKPAAVAWAKAVAAGEPSALARAARPHLLSQPIDTAKALPLLRKAAAGGSIDAYLQLLIVLREHPTQRVAGDP